jgi:hypothetical protein
MLVLIYLLLVGVQALSFNWVAFWCMCALHLVFAILGVISQEEEKKK